MYLKFRLHISCLLLALLPLSVHAEDIHVEANTIQGSTNLQTMTLEGDALFVFGKSTLTDKGKKALDDLLASKLFPLDHYKITGHTDSMGSMSDNRTLSLRRAQAVQNYLYSQNKNLKMKSVGMGSTQPKVTCSKKLKRSELVKCLAPNRRVEIERIDHQ